jgi:outer membrane protein assembly factor BamB
MTTQSTVGPRPRKPLRLWPGVALGVVILALRYVVPEIGNWVLEPDTALTVALVAFLGSIVAAILILAWWLLFSRAPWVDRLLALGLVVVGFLAGPLVQDRSITTGAMGMLYPILVIPIVGLAFVAWAVLTRRLSVGMRRVTMAAAILLAFASLGLIRTGGFTASMKHDFAWRWSATPEERLLAAEPEPAAAPPVAPTATPAAAPAPAPAPLSAPVSASPTPTPAPTAGVPAATTAPDAPSPVPAAVAMPRPEWPGFRGPERDGVVSGTRIAVDWAATPPVAMWKRAVGPGWSSFAVAGDRLYTQEQRGEDELVACYSTSTGAPVWQHRDRARFWESNGGAGPRGTPLVHQGRVYALGATGIVNALDAGTGAVVWTRNAAADTGAKTPMWGFSGSPIVVDTMLIVPTSGALSAYDLATGAPRWKVAPEEAEGYTSPQLVQIDGVRQVLFVNSVGVSGLSPTDGKILWSSAWKGYPIVQPQVVAGGGVLFAVQEGQGLRRIAVSRGTGAWTASETWTSKGLKPYFNDFVVHKGYAYGFDSNILSCIDLADGSRKWKGGRYGNGQLVLLADQDAMLVLGEEGEIALVKATPDGFTELAKMPGLDGKTWNHPVVVGDRLLVRNGEQMAAFRLPVPAR